MSGFLILSDVELAGLGITTAEVLTALEAAIAAQARGAVQVAPKSAVLPGDGRYVMTTLATGDAPDLTVVKSVMVSPRNPSRGLPGVEGVVLVQDSETGEMLALMQAGWLTGVRTAGLSAVAARRLAAPAAETITFVGTGAQARSHLAAFCDLFPLRRAVLVGRGAGNLERLGALARARGLEVEIASTPQAALAAADIVVSSVTLAYGMEPFLDARWLKPGAFAAITDAGVPWRAEGMAALAPLYIDDQAQELENSRPMVEPALVSGDLATLVTGPALARDPAARAGFVFRGMAIGDFAIAALALDRAREARVGTLADWRPRPGSDPA
ncbi:ornithine cyclodeaminase family protein [Ruegeria sp. WL0004]|uniref:Ornithine cyclodeaminase family protein n=1 Tax=Ruegeria marisflavi TaxID=2984152 RepID=A0ABT2WVM8_9RHOB|nr:ornithine cyclodeaminase family protein [Ruegeria sp. WL0004]MCU9839292.1 ornithine cyclodeaminase family protein [Ruegeria sp. WL0004]